MNNILISTTDSIPGYETSEYIALISKQVVVGSSFVSEFFASFTDVLGGRSHRFEADLGYLYQSLTDQMMIEACEIKANALVGLRVDIDEISGNGKQMFMISGLATAVVVQPIIHTCGAAYDENKTAAEIEKQNLINTISSKHLKSDIQMYQDILLKGSSIKERNKFNILITTAAREGNFDVQIKAFDLALLASCILGSEKYISLFDRFYKRKNDHSNEASYPAVFSTIIDCFSKYQTGFEENIVTKALGGNGILTRAVLRILDVDYGLLAEYVPKIPIYYWDAIVLPLIFSNKENYKPSDITDIGKLITTITTSFKSL